MRDTRTGFINHDQWDDLFNALYQEENEIMQYLTKQELILINQEWQEEYEQKEKAEQQKSKILGQKQVNRKANNKEKVNV